MRLLHMYVNIHTPPLYLTTLRIRNLRISLETHHHQKCEICWGSGGIKWLLVHHNCHTSTKILHLKYLIIIYNHMTRPSLKPRATYKWIAHTDWMWQKTKVTCILPPTPEIIYLFEVDIHCSIRHPQSHILRSEQYQQLGTVRKHKTAQPK